MTRRKRSAEMTIAAIEFLRSGETYALEVAPSLIGRRAWVGIHPFKIRCFKERPENFEDLPFQFRIIWFEYDREFDTTNYYLEKEYMTTLQELIVTSIEEVADTITGWGFSLEQFKDRDGVDYPL